ncbi:MAG TPA: tripartite tricarboxylate transporter substrate binding protein [Burkholderiales bacterium]|nr:tripartite tricarboxylate transporter substrate binding protein [Burkholderiales bacterium]
MKILALALAAVLVSVTAPAAAADKYPTRPIRLIAPFPPGGGTDILSRIIAVPATETLGQTVVVDNRPGAGGAIGAELTAHAEPNGHTLILVSSSYAATAAYRKPTYDPIDGIAPIILIGTTGLLMITHPTVTAKSIPELIAYAKANPGKLNYASVGTGSVSHLAHEAFRLATGVKIVHVPFKGGGPALQGVIGNEVQIGAVSIVPTIPHVRAGRLRAIGVTTPKRTPLLPDVASIGEAVPGFEVTHWYGMWAPKGTPKPIISTWNQIVAKLLDTDAMKKRAQAEGLDAAGGPPSEFHQRLRTDIEKWRKVVKAADIK